MLIKEYKAKIDAKIRERDANREKEVRKKCHNAGFTANMAC